MGSDGTSSVFRGVGVALLTLFDETGAVEVKATAELANTLVELGMRGVIVGGSTAEAATLSGTERAELIRAVRDAIPADIPVVAGTGAPSSRQAIEYTRQAADAGASAALVLTPHRVPDPRPYYAKVAEAVPDLPLLAYHFPAAAEPGIRTDLLPDLPVVGVKDSTGDPDRLLTELASFDGDIYTGSAAVLGYAGPLGCAGAIVALGNAQPELCVRAFDGDFAAQRELTEAHLAAKGNFPHGLKALVAQRFGTPTHARID
ncbi:4-hydroxy-tetrahydrodipicolinate synthase [Tamaricihabitans halophyticus]|uniref:4-hydroxy-tetrahydrodipicolinate synthase n=1 Tax=Tamaricihabitans halophyticus TaxID=1262583 RepID=A0A4V2SV85_9PSEU|nr:dihydrodipicolinate synthase family protein [Tamaricihabitans halophyticus]TCP57356.1 4-hydroxy-tetrahydrodipicolinate synthase [Tamaricihabitans halophyticus]